MSKKYLFILFLTINHLIISYLATAQSSELIAHFPMKDSPINLIDDYKNLRMVNVKFINQALYCEGEYGDFDNNEGKMISTPPLDALDLNEFTISIQFKAVKNEQMPVFVLGRACRLLSFVLENDGKITLESNNGDEYLETQLEYQPNTWHQATITYEKNNSTAQIYLDGEWGGSLNLDFSDSCLGEWLSSNTDISTTNYSNGKCFQGYWRDLKVYNGIQLPTKANPPVVNQAKLAKIEWQNPKDNTTISKSKTYTLKACVKSDSKITKSEILVNGKLLKNNSARGFEVVNAESCDMQIEQIIELKTGNNEIIINITNAAGTQTAQTFISYVPDNQIVINNAPINQKIKKTILPTNGAQPYQKKSSYDPYSVLICPDKNNGSYIGWKDTKQQIHISRLNAQNQVVKDVKIANEKTILYAICADETGFATLLVREATKDMNWIYFAKYTNDGVKVFENKLIGDYNFDKEGNRAFSDWSTPRLAYNGREYMAFFGIYRRWDDGVTHQGDMGLIIDKTGKIDERQGKYLDNQYVVTNGSSWGSSHSFEQRLIFDGLYFHTLAKGDAYPRGIAYTRILSDLKTTQAIKTIGKETVFKMSGQIGENYVPLALGGFASTGIDGECVASFISNEGRSSYDVGFLLIDEKGKVEQKWLTNTPNLDENNCYLAKYGENYLIAWTALNHQSPDPETELDDFVAIVVDKKGNIITPAFDLAAQFQRRYIVHEFRWEKFPKAYNDFNYLTNDFINFSNGDIGWVWTNENNQIELIRITL
jgi:hypothetical protein